MAGLMDEVIADAARRARERRAQVDDAAGIAQLRRSTGLSQRAFARALEISVDTLQNWEQGRRRPVGPARTLLRLIAREPHLLAQL